MPLRRSRRVKRASAPDANKNEAPTGNKKKLSRKGRRRKKPTKKVDTEVIPQQNEENWWDNFSDQDSGARERNADTAASPDYRREEDVDSDGSSITSGPSTLARPDLFSLYLCSACHELYEKVTTMRKPIKNKRRDDDPNSLTCDQWIFINRDRLGALHPPRQRTLAHALTKTQYHHEAVVHPSCSRQHVFLHRNLRSCVKRPDKRRRTRRKRKMAKAKTPETRVAKQRRVHSDSRQQEVRAPAAEYNWQSSGVEFGDWNDSRGYLWQSDATLTEIPSASGLSRAARKEGRTMSEFKILLAQLRGSSRMIVKETT